MKYIDEGGQPIESPDMSLGYLEDAEWIDHEEVPEKYHIEYNPLDGGGREQVYVIESPYVPAWREVTVQRYIRYTADELEAIREGNYGARCDALELRCDALESHALDVRTGMA